MNDLRGRLKTLSALKDYISGGNATLTTVSLKTGQRLTLKFKRPKEEGGARDRTPIWVRLLTGPDNESNYTFLGTIWLPDFYYVIGRHSSIGEDAPSQKLTKWLSGILAMNLEKSMEQAEFWHEGRCGRCGRTLTVPESIDSGFGPECIKHIGH